MSSHRFRVTEHVVPGQHIREYPAATNGDQNEVLEICLKQYTPLEWADSEPPEGALTIIGTHANAMPKVRAPGRSQRDYLLFRNSMNHFGTTSLSSPVASFTSAVSGWRM
jgi:hypothetical protein